MLGKKKPEKTMLALITESIQKQNGALTDILDGVIKDEKTIRRAMETNLNSIRALEGENDALGIELHKIRKLKKDLRNTLGHDVVPDDIDAWIVDVIDDHPQKSEDFDKVEAAMAAEDIYKDDLSVNAEQSATFICDRVSHKCPKTCNCSVPHGYNKYCDESCPMNRDDIQCVEVKA